MLSCKTPMWVKILSSPQTSWFVSGAPGAGHTLFICVRAFVCVTCPLECTQMHSPDSLNLSLKLCFFRHLLPSLLERVNRKKHHERLWADSQLPYFTADPFPPIYLNRCKGYNLMYWHYGMQSHILPTFSSVFKIPRQEPVFVNGNIWPHGGMR